MTWLKGDKHGKMPRSREINEKAKAGRDKYERDR